MLLYFYNATQPCISMHQHCYSTTKCCILLCINSDIMLSMMRHNSFLIIYFDISNKVSTLALFDTKLYPSKSNNDITDMK